MFAHAPCVHTVEIALAGLPPKMATCVYPLTPSPAHSSSPFFVGGAGMATVGRM